MRPLIRTTHDVVPTIARLVLGLVILPHGLQKAFGMFGGYGFQGTMGFFTGSLHIPYVFGVLAIAAELLGGLGLIVGLLGRVAAFGVAMVMAVAVLTSHASFGFFMNWSGQQKGEGFEYHLLALALAAIVMVRGSGAASVDLALDRGATAPVRPLTPARV